MEALSGLDASFLYLESDDVPMNIGGVAILEGSLRFDDFLAFLSTSVHTVDRLQQKLASVASGVDRSYWVKDPDFDINRHVFRRQLPKPDGWQELRQMASDVFSGQIERDKPLWEFVFVEGGDSAKLAKFVDAVYNYSANSLSYR
jgi:hypothetical protein